MAELEYEIEGEEPDDVILPDDITLIDLATSSGYSYEWVQAEILHTVAMMGLIALENGGDDAFSKEQNKSRTVRFTVDIGDDPESDEIAYAEITVRLCEERKKNRLN